MATTITVSSVRRVGGKTYVRFNDKTEMEFESLRQVEQFVRAYRDDVKEFLRAIVIAKWLNANPDGGNPAQLEGRSVTIDLDAAANIVRVS